MPRALLQQEGEEEEEEDGGADIFSMHTVQEVNSFKDRRKETNKKDECDVKSAATARWLWQSNSELQEPDR